MTRNSYETGWSGERYLLLHGTENKTDVELASGLASCHQSSCSSFRFFFPSSLARRSGRLSPHIAGRWMVTLPKSPHQSSKIGSTWLGWGCAPIVESPSWASDAPNPGNDSISPQWDGLRWERWLFSRKLGCYYWKHREDSKCPHSQPDWP